MPSKADQMPITPALLTWARERAGYSIDEAAEDFPQIREWEDASSNSGPTYPQLERMADKFKCPVALFFFPEPPVLPPINETFRTLPQAELDQIPRRVKLLLRKAKAMQLSLRELTDGRNPAPRLITRDLTFDPDVSPAEMARVVRAYVGVSIEEQFSWQTADEALEKWRGVVNDSGVFVFKDAFRQKGFFGFCLYDEEFPVIFVNNTSAKTRQIFTIIHELSHLLFHTSGIDIQSEDYIDDLPDAAKRIEIKCNKFAADFLVPPEIYASESAGLPRDRDSAALLANRFSVSREVIYRKFLDAGEITQHEYQAAATEWANEVGSSTEGGNFYNNQMAYLGRRYIGLALERFYQNKIDRTQLAEHLNIKPSNIPGIEERYFRARG
jgi:Zn-dependent peptidase ImmA (M78 family)/transcriptional regulator with XRE-family HTH domain